MSHTEANTLTMECFYQSTPCLCAHVKALIDDPNKYLEELRALQKSPAWQSVSSGVKSRILAALHATGKHEAVREALIACEIPDINKAFALLDRPRLKRQLEKKIAKLKRERTPQQQQHNDTGDLEATELTEPSIETDGNTRLSCTRTKTIKRKRRQALEKLEKQHQDLTKLLSLGGEDGNHQGLPCEKAHQDSAVIEKIQSTSLSGALAGKARKRIKLIPTNRLETDMLGLPPEPWKRLADWIHLSPSDLTVPYFLADIHGESIPEDSFVSTMRKLIAAKTAFEAEKLYRQVVANFPQVYKSYAFLRTTPVFTMNNNQAIINDLANGIPLETVIWYFEELNNRSKNCQSILEARLANPDSVMKDIATSDSKVYCYGKLIERILTFQKMGMASLANKLIPLAEREFSRLKEKVTVTGDKIPNVLVIGDASASMQTAIESSTIMSTMVSSCLNGELCFFSDRLIESPYKRPSGVMQTLEICKKIRANNCTCLAAGLMPSYKEKRVVDTIVLVTDEEENTEMDGFYFASLLRKYLDEVNPNVLLFVVCVGSGDLRFRHSLSANNISYTTDTIDYYRPDLTKFDALLAKIAKVSSHSNDDDFTMEKLAPGEEETEEFVVVE